MGEGRIGLKDGKTEKVQCRATYFVNPAGNELKQNIRCASASGKIEVKSLVNATKDGKLNGTWNELVYNLGGEMTGEVTERGLRIVVRAGDLTANMDVIVMNDRQIVEIQFFNSTLRGLTLILKKGSLARRARPCSASTARPSAWPAPAPDCYGVFPARRRAAHGRGHGRHAGALLPARRPRGRSAPDPRPAGPPRRPQRLDRVRSTAPTGRLAHTESPFTHTVVSSSAALAPRRDGGVVGPALRDAEGGGHLRRRVAGRHARRRARAATAASTSSSVGRRRGRRALDHDDDLADAARLSARPRRGSASVAAPHLLVELGQLPGDGDPPLAAERRRRGRRACAARRWGAS